MAPETSEKVTRRSSTGAKATTPAKQVEEGDFDADSIFAEVDFLAAFAEVAPETSEKVTRRSSTGAKATTPAKQVEEGNFDADAAFAEVS